MTKTQKCIGAAALGLVIGFLLAWGYSAANAAAPVTTGMEVVDTARVTSLGSVVYKILDHDNGNVCYVLGASSISCIQHGQ